MSPYRHAPFVEPASYRTRRGERILSIAASVAAVIIAVVLVGATLAHVHACSHPQLTVAP